VNRNTISLYLKINIIFILHLFILVILAFVSFIIKYIFLEIFLEIFIHSKYKILKNIIRYQKIRENFFHQEGSIQGRVQTIYVRIIMFNYTRHSFIYGKNGFAEVSTNLALDTDLKIILLNYQNNIGRSN